MTLLGGDSLDFCLYSVSVEQGMRACLAEVKWTYSKGTHVCHPLVWISDCWKNRPREIGISPEILMEEKVAETGGFQRRNIYNLLRPHRRDLEMDYCLVMHISGLWFKLCSHDRPPEGGPWKSVKNLPLLFSSLAHLNKLPFIHFIIKKLKLWVSFYWHVI